MITMIKRTPVVQGGGAFINAEAIIRAFTVVVLWIHSAVISGALCNSLRALTRECQILQFINTCSVQSVIKLEDYYPVTKSSLPFHPMTSVKFTGRWEFGIVWSPTVRAWPLTGSHCVVTNVSRSNHYVDNQHAPPGDAVFTPPHVCICVGVLSDRHRPHLSIFIALSLAYYFKM